MDELEKSGQDSVWQVYIVETKNYILQIGCEVSNV